MVFAGMFMGNNKNSSASTPVPSTYNLFFEVFSIGPGGQRGSIDAFGVASPDIPADSGPILVRDGIDGSSDSPVNGQGFDMLGDPGMFEVIGASFDNLQFMGNEWSCHIHSITGDITIRLPVGMM